MSLRHIGYNLELLLQNIFTDKKSSFFEEILLMQDPQSQIRPCPICSYINTKIIGTVSQTTNLSLERSNYSLVSCVSCQLLYLNPLPTLSDLRQIYIAQSQFSSPDYTTNSSAVMNYILPCFTRIAKIQKWQRPIKVLEIGAGRAWMCRAAKLVDPLNVTIAQDITPEVRTECPYVDQYHVGDLFQIRQLYGPFDLVSLTHVIEHLIDPLAYMKFIAANLSHDGVSFVTAPLRPSDVQLRAMETIDTGVFKYLHVPAHLQYFSETAMAIVAKQAGLELVHYDPNHDAGEVFEAVLTAS